MKASVSIKIRLIVIFLLLCVLVLLFKDKMFFGVVTIDSNAMESIGGVMAVSSASRYQEKDSNNVPLISSEDVEEQWNPVVLNEANRAEVNKWFASRGNYDFYGPDERNDYQNYDLETLKKLSQEGDIRAMHVLANNQDNLPARKFFLQQAALYGSTAALAQIGTMIETEKDFSNKSEKERRPYEVEALAYYEAATLRGDRWAQLNNGDSLLRRYPIELTQQDRQLIRTRGKEIYDFYQQGRDTLSLGEFDNSVPDIVNQFFDETISNSCNKKYNQNPSPYLCEAN